jgi:hypothetical protein
MLKSRQGRRTSNRVRGFFAALIAVAAVSAVSASAAAAAPFSLTADYGFASIGCGGMDGCTLSDSQILDPDNAVTLSGTITPGPGGAFTIPAGQLLQKTFPVTVDPGPPAQTVDVTLHLIAVDPVAGTYDAGTGALTANVPHLKATVQANVPPAGPIDCTIDPIAVVGGALTTGATGYHNGVSFQGANPPLGYGAIAGAWNDLPAPVATNVLDLVSAGACPIFDSYIDGPGGVWLSHGLSTIDAPPVPTSLTTNPASPNEANNILVKGTGAAFPGGVLVYLNNATCTGISSFSGPSTDYNAAGIPVTVPEDATTQIRVRVLDGANRLSPCSAPLSYTDPVATPPSTGGGGGGTVTPPPPVKKCKKTQKLKKGKCVKKKKKKKK